MNENKAREILGDTIQPGDELQNDSDWVSWNNGSSTVRLDSDFTAEELEAIAWWMRNKAK